MIAYTYKVFASALLAMLLLGAGEGTAADGPVFGQPVHQSGGAGKLAVSEDGQAFTLSFSDLEVAHEAVPYEVMPDNRTGSSAPIVSRAYSIVLPIKGDRARPRLFVQGYAFTTPGANAALLFDVNGQSSLIRFEPVPTAATPRRSPSTRRRPRRPALRCFFSLNGRALRQGERLPPCQHRRRNADVEENFLPRNIDARPRPRRPRLRAAARFRIDPAALFSRNRLSAWNGERWEQHMERFIGGSPLAVFLRLVVISIVTGIALKAAGYDPRDLLANIPRLIQAIYDFGFGWVQSRCNISCSAR